MDPFAEPEEPDLKHGSAELEFLIEKLEALVKFALQPFLSKCVENAEQYAIIRLTQNNEGVEKGTQKKIKEYYKFIALEFAEFGLIIPRTNYWRTVFLKIDGWYEHKVSNVTSKSARFCWADYEAKKTHFLLTYARRNCLRGGVSRCLHVEALKRTLVEKWEIPLPSPKTSSSTSLPESCDEHDEIVVVSSDEEEFKASSYCASAMASIDDVDLSDYESMQLTTSEEEAEEQVEACPIEDVLEEYEEFCPGGRGVLLEEYKEYEELPEGNAEVLDSSEEEAQPIHFSTQPLSSPGAGQQQSMPKFVAKVLNQTERVIPDSVQHKADLAAAAKKRRLDHDKKSAPDGATKAGKAGKASKASKSARKRGKALKGELKVMMKTEKTRAGSFWCLMRKGTPNWTQVMMCTPGQFGSLDAAKVACDTFMTMLENGASVEEVKKAKALCLT